MPYLDHDRYNMYQPKHRRKPLNPPRQNHMRTYDVNGDWEFGRQNAYSNRYIAVQHVRNSPIDDWTPSAGMLMNTMVSQLLMPSLMKGEYVGSYLAILQSRFGDITESFC